LIQNSKFWSSLEAQRFHPLGLLPPQDAENHRICDFYEGASGKCLQWSSRPSECSSYFCEEGLSKFRSKGPLTAENFVEQSKVSFEFEFQIAQASLRACGFSQAEVESWVVSWNYWVHEKRPFETPWDWPIEDRFEFYQTLWDWVLSQSLDELLERVNPNVRVHFEKELQIS